VRFNLKDKKALDMEEVKKAFKAQGFREATLKSGPKEAAGEKK
jgi:hypothetical protein